MLSSTEAEYVALSAFTQEVKFVSMLLGGMNKVERPYIIYDDNQGGIFLAKNSQVGIHTNHIDIRHHCLQGMVEEKYIDIQYIRSEENPDDGMTQNTSKAGSERHIRRIAEGDLWEFVDTGRETFNKTGFTDDVINLDKNENSSHTLALVVDGTNKND